MRRAGKRFHAQMPALPIWIGSREKSTLSISHAKLPSGESAMAKLLINGTSHNLDIEPEMPLLWALRNELGLSGTKYGCGIAQCGACTVLVDGKAVRSCTLPVSAVEGEAGHHHRGLGRQWPAASRPGSLGGGRCAAVRLLPIGPDTVRGGAVEAEAQSHRRGHQHDLQYLPLRYLCPCPARHPSCGRQGLRPWQTRKRMSRAAKSLLRARPWPVEWRWALSCPPAPWLLRRN